MPDGAETSCEAVIADPQVLLVGISGFQWRALPLELVGELVDSGEPTTQTAEIQACFVEGFIYGEPDIGVRGNGLRVKALNLVRVRNPGTLEREFRNGNLRPIPKTGFTTFFRLG